MARDGQWRVLPAVVAILLVAASCSAADGLLGNQADDTIDSETTADPTAVVEGGAEAADQENGVEEDAEPVRPSIWVRGGDAPMRPTSPLASMSELMAPGGGLGWTIVGSIFDYDTGTSNPAVWSADEPDSYDSWTRIVLEQPDGGGAEMAGAVRVEGIDVAVGSHGRGRDRRPAVWARPADDQWRSVDRTQFDRGAPEWLSHVAVNRSNGLIMAVGGQTDADGKSSPILWISADGEQWEAVEGLPFAAEGTEELRALTAGSTTSVLTGGQHVGSVVTAIAYWSEDGRTWTEAKVETPTDGGESYLGEAVWFNNRFVAVGGVAADGVFRPASWTSDDGEVWALQKPPFETIDDGRSINVGFGALGVTSTDLMLYATAGSSFLQHLWQSSDGANWTVVGDITDVRAQGLSVDSMAAVDNQVLLATDQPGIVIYQDGYDEAPLGSEMLPVPDEVPWVADISHDGDSWLAVGGSSVQLGTGGTRPSAMLWRSADGVDWELAERLPEASTGAVSAVASWSGGLAAVGTESPQSATAQNRLGRGLVWQFSESNWTEINAPSSSDDNARIGLETMTAAGDDLLAGGWRFAPANGNIDAFLVQSNAQAAPEQVDIGHGGSANELVAALCGNESGEAVALVSVQRPEINEVAALRRSPDGTWSDSEWPLSSQGEDVNVSECVYGVDGFLAAGFTVSGADDNVGLWRSADGSSWERVIGPPSFSAPANQWVDSMAVTEAGYLLAGNDASGGEVQPVIWYGSGDDWERTVIAEAATMSSLEIAYAEGTVVVTGWNDGAVQAYSTTLDQLIAELDQ